MKNILIIFKKELLDTLRDRRTIFMMVLLPLILVPLFMVGVNKVMLSQEEKAETKHISIGISGEEFAPQLFDLLNSDDKILIDNTIPTDSFKVSIKRGDIDGAIIIDENFSKNIINDDQALIKLLYQGSDAFESVFNRVSISVDKLDSIIIDERVSRLGININLFDPIFIEKVDLSSLQETIGKIAGGFLPYLFIIFGFMGAMYPGIDLGAGEKERGTLETLLSTPTKRIQIILGKFLVVMIAAIITALIAMLGVFIAIRLLPELTNDFLPVIKQMFSFKIIFMILTLVIPISAFFSALILSLSIYAKSFKEAQSMITPFNIAIIFPALLGTLPGIELNFKTALIPIMNVSLATKEVLAGTINPALLIEVYLSLFIFAAISILFCVKWFQREETLFRV
jgi:sodium transport system permease protein